MVGADVYYARHLGNVFFVFSQRYADSLYDATVGRLGGSVRDYTIYIEREPLTDLNWVYGHSLALAPYLGLDHQHIVWVEQAQEVASLPDVDPEQTLVFRSDWSSSSLVDVTDGDPWAALTDRSHS